jgi:hypothetical protein
MSTKQKRTPGLIKRCGVWHIDKQIGGQRICESTGTGDLAEALRQLARRIDQIRQAAVYGVRPRRTFREAATKYLTEGNKRSIGRDAQDLRIVVPYVGDLFVDEVHMGTLQTFLTSVVRRVEERDCQQDVGHRPKDSQSRCADVAGRTWVNVVGNASYDSAAGLGRPTASVSLVVGAGALVPALASLPCQDGAV